MVGETMNAVNLIDHVHVQYNVIIKVKQCLVCLYYVHDVGIGSKAMFYAVLNMILSHTYRY